MSTRCNIVLKSGRESLKFYKHSDGYPEHTMPILEKFLDGVKSGKYRDNVSQSAGWLIELGRTAWVEDMGLDACLSGMYAWKVGYIEPTTCIHDDIEYLYTIDLVKKTITIKNIYSSF